MLSIAICDDEMIDCCKIAKEVKAILENMKIPCVIRQFYSGRELLQAVEYFDMIFLDIMMRGMDGMQTAQLLREKAFDKILIFVSSSREYVLEAYDVEAYYYLTKPVNRSKLTNLMKRATIKLKQSSDEFIIIRKEGQSRKLLLRDIYYFEIRGRVIYAHGVEGIFDYYEQIGVLEQVLREKGFFRCHKSFLVNLYHINAYDHEEMTLDNGEKIVIAKRRYEAFGKAVLDFMKRSGGNV